MTILLLPLSNACEEYVHFIKQKSSTCPYNHHTVNFQPSPLGQKCPLTQIPTPTNFFPHSQRLALRFHSNTSWLLTSTIYNAFLNMIISPAQNHSGYNPMCLDFIPVNINQTVRNLHFHYFIFHCLAFYNFLSC